MSAILLVGGGIATLVVGAFVWSVITWIAAQFKPAAKDDTYGSYTVIGHGRAYTSIHNDYVAKKGGR